MQKIIGLLILMLLWQACPSSKKQRDTRNLSWYQIISDGKNKEISIGINEDFPELISSIEEKAQNEVLKKLNISVKVSAYKTLTQIDQFDLIVDDMGNMNLLADQSLLVNPVFSKIAICEQKMTENPTYKSWFDMTKNNFVPLLIYEPVFQKDSVTVKKKNRNAVLLTAYQWYDNPEYFKQSPDADAQRADAFLDSIKSNIEENKFANVYHSLQNGLNVNNPLFLGIPKSSPNIAAAMLVTDALINEIASDTQFISIINQPDIKPTFHKNWYVRLFKDEEK